MTLGGMRRIAALAILASLAWLVAEPALARLAERRIRLGVVGLCAASARLARDRRRRQARTGGVDPRRLPPLGHLPLQL